MAIPFMGKRQPKIIAKLPKPSEVFTPRSANVTDMYVERPALETALNGIFDSNEVRYLYGHSGSGKTWLYKSVFKRSDVYSYVVGFQDLSDNMSFDDLIKQHLGHLSLRTETSTIEGRAAEAKVAGVGGAIGKSTKTRPFERGPLDLLMQTIRRFADERQAVLVFENVERVVRREDVVAELAKVIMSVDNDNFAAHEVRVLLVGTVKDLVYRLSELPNSQPILTRLETLPEVSRLADSEAKKLVEHGLFGRLSLEAAVDKARLLNRTLERTDRVPLHLHSYCLELATSAIERERKIDAPAELNAFHRWVDRRVAQHAGPVFAHMNSKDTSLKVRTRVLYCAANTRLPEFRALDVKNMLDNEWPELEIANASVATALNELAGEAAKTRGKLDAVLERVNRAGVNHYRFVDPVYRIAARTGLKKGVQGEIEREEILGGI